MHTAAHPALVLNADYRPLSYFPLSLLSWKDTITAIVKGHLTVVAEYETVVRSPSTEIRLPSVVALRDYTPVAKRVAFTRNNVFLRDRFRCQYCGEETKLTFDHVVPRSRGGDTTWTNIVAACGPCNLKKGSRTDMQPMKVPREPTARELLALKRAFLPKQLHASWLDFLEVDLAA
jgi:5-methylcytosine-specific restriction endonuclease McrA